MNKRFFKAICCFATLASVGMSLVACSGDDLMQPAPDEAVEEVSPMPGEQVYRVTVQAGETPLELDGGDAPSRASFVEVDGNEGNNYYLWQTNDKLVVFANTKKLGELTLLPGHDGKRTADFEGELTAKPEEMAGELVFVYLGKNALLTTAADKTSKISIDLSKQQGTRQDIANNSILWGKGKLQAKSAKVYTTVGSSIGLVNPMGIFHFSIAAPEGGGNLTNLAISGEGIYSSVNIDLANGMAAGDAQTNGYKWRVPDAAKKDNAYDVYYVLAPGELTPTFTTYDDKNPTRVGPWLGKEPGITRYTSQQALIHNESGVVSNFTAKDTEPFPDGSHQPKVFQFTRGNLQYVLGQRVGQFGGVKITAKRNTLTRFDHRVGSSIPVPTSYTDGQAGEYRLAAEQWEVVRPKADQLHPLKEYGGSYYYMGDGDDTVIDLFGWGNVQHPDLAKRVGQNYDPLIAGYYRSEYYDLKGDPRTDYGTKVYVDGQATTMPSVNELVCILYKRKFSDAPTYSMSTRAWIDLDDNGFYDSYRDIGGIVVFPDGMLKADADKCWGTSRNNEYELEAAGGSLAHSDWGSTTSKTQNRLKKEAIAMYGLLFLPSTGGADMKRTDNQWKMANSRLHANYLCSDWQGSAPSRLFKNGYYPQQGSTYYASSGGLYPNSRKNTHTDNGWTDVNGWLGVRLAVIKK